MLCFDSIILFFLMWFYVILYSFFGLFWTDFPDLLYSTHDFEQYLIICINAGKCFTLFQQQISIGKAKRKVSAHFPLFWKYLFQTENDMLEILSCCVLFHLKLIEIQLYTIFTPVLFLKFILLPLYIFTFGVGAGGGGGSPVKTFLNIYYNKFLKVH